MLQFPLVPRFHNHLRLQAGDTIWFSIFPAYTFRMVRKDNCRKIFTKHMDFQSIDQQINTLIRSSNSIQEKIPIDFLDSCKVATIKNDIA